MATAPSRDRRNPPAPNALGCYLLEQAGKRSGPPTTGSARPEMIRPSTVAEYVSHEQHDGSTQERDRVGARSNRKERRPYLPWPLLTEAGSRTRALGRGRNAGRDGADGVRPRPCSSPLLNKTLWGRVLVPPSEILAWSRDSICSLGYVKNDNYGELECLKVGVPIQRQPQRSPSQARRGSTRAVARRWRRAGWRASSRRRIQV